MDEMCANEIEIHIIIIEIHLDTTLIAPHLAYSTRLPVGGDCPIEELLLRILAVANDKYLPHMEVVNLFTIMAEHVLVQTFDEFLTLM